MNYTEVIEAHIQKQRICNEKDSTGIKYARYIYNTMQASKGLENDPIVGNKFFENVPPVGITNHLNPLVKSNGVKQLTGTNVRVLQKPKAVIKVQDTTVVKGFGGTPLFVLGMLTRAEEKGECIRLDGDTGKKDRLSDAEYICRRNPTMVRKLHKEEESLETKDNDYEINEDELMPIDFLDETLASDFDTKSGNFGNVRRQTELLRRGGKVWA